MKVLLVNNGNGWGGGQEFLLELACELRKQAFEIHFVVRGGSPSEDRFRKSDFAVHPVFRDVTSFFSLATVMRRERFDVVSINREHDIPLTVISRFMAFPFLRTGRLVANYHIPVARRQPFLGVMDAVICVSDYIRDSLLRLYPAVAKKTCVISNGISTAFVASEEKYSPTRRRRYFQDSSFPLIGMVGAFWKNQAELVDCIPLLKDKFPNIKVVFVGDNTDLPLVSPVMKKIRELGVENQVIFTGKVARESIHDIFFDLDVSVSTHRNEGFGIVHLESLTAGTPVVSYNAGGVRDILAGRDVGVLVDGGHEEFSKEVAALIDDDARRYRMGRAGVNLVRQQFSDTAMALKYRMVLEKLCRGDV